jgi:hypothetical protein
MNLNFKDTTISPIVFSSGLHVMFMFSPFVGIIVGRLGDRMSQIRTVLSPEAVLNKSGLMEFQHI